MKPLVSIIVPVYNVENYLPRCLDSIKEQMYRNFEVILVNDGSSDHSLDILNEYAKKDRRFRVLNQENNGVSTARNLGLSNSVGDYICFIDADDYVSPLYIDTLVETSLLYKSDISICDYCSEGSFEEAKKDIRTYSREEAIKAWIQYNDMNGCIWGKLFKHNIVKGILFDINYRLGEDQIFLFESFKRASKFVRINAKLYFYYNRPKSAMRKEFDMRFYDSIKMAEWFGNEGVNFFPSMADLFKKKEVLTYVAIIIMAAKSGNDTSKKIIIELLPRVKNSNTFHIIRYCSLRDIKRYFSIKYLSRLSVSLLRSKI